MFVFVSRMRRYYTIFMQLLHYYMVPYDYCTVLCSSPTSYSYSSRILPVVMRPDSYSCSIPLHGSYELVLLIVVDTCILVGFLVVHADYFDYRTGFIMVLVKDQRYRWFGGSIAANNRGGRARPQPRSRSILLTSRSTVLVRTYKPPYIGTFDDLGTGCRVSIRTMLARTVLEFCAFS